MPGFEKKTWVYTIHIWMGILGNQTKTRRPVTEH